MMVGERERDEWWDHAMVVGREQLFEVVASMMVVCRGGFVV